VGCEMGAERGFVEGRDLKREMIDVAAFDARGGPARLPARSVERHEIDLRMTGTELDQPDVFLTLVDRAAERADIEGKAAIEIGDAQHNVVNAEKRERSHGPSVLLECQAQREPLGVGILAGLSANP